ncbi:hypothetical protein DFO61_1208 [Ectopseudomonas oleovorans]|uniref:Uncharacterized protein n=1 Tax=Ectopseudomonas oleovorans TaxID=301 RepID=A0A397NB03_ECTOL|nr:hypothetical protein [Pseudomonas oleovorans]RIA34556.1 hypothetical protein DFO61_1208 [Pseudomonas oleovorans]
MTTENEVVPYKNADFTCSNCQLIQELSFDEVCQLKDGNHLNCPKCASPLQLPEAERNRLLAQIARAGRVGKTMAVGGLLIFAATAVSSILFGAVASVIGIGICLAFCVLMSLRRKSIGFLKLLLVPVMAVEVAPLSSAPVSE